MTRRSKARKPQRGIGASRRVSGPPGRSDEGVTGAGRRTWLAGKRPVLRFVLVLATATGVFNALFYLWLSKASIFTAYLGLNARLCAALLRLLGSDATAAGTLVSGTRFGLDIHLGCDAIQSSAFYAFAVLASPLRVSPATRILPIVLGTAFLLAMNLVRIVTLYVTGAHFPAAFEVMHVEIWQAAFIFMPIVLWLVWVRHHTRRGAERTDGAR